MATCLDDASQNAAFSRDTTFDSRDAHATGTSATAVDESMITDIFYQARRRGVAEVEIQPTFIKLVLVSAVADSGRHENGARWKPAAAAATQQQPAPITGVDGHDARGATTRVLPPGLDLESRATRAGGGQRKRSKAY